MKTKLIYRITSSLLCLLMAAPAMADKEGEQWYVKMTAFVDDNGAVFYDDRSGIFGRLHDAKKNLDQHDVPAFVRVDDPNQPASIAIVFETDQEGEEKVGRQYLSNYKETGTNKRVWDFTLYSSHHAGDVTLTWEGVYAVSGEFPYFTSVEEPNHPIRGQLTLIDKETGQAIPAVDSSGQMNSYEFNMDGKPARYFRWVQGKVNKSDLKIVQVEFVD